ncbi:MAG TPA: efflux RND transporter periplasmic adaptor subunit [Chthoniobacter sp.]|jgi:multidrug resistance efflux pump
MSSSPSSLASRGDLPASETIAPDAQRLQAQLAGLADGAGNSAPELLPLLQHLRTLLGAKTLAFLPVTSGEASDVISAGIAVPGLAKLRDALDPTKATVLPAPSLGATGYTLSVPLVREGVMRGWLVALLVIPQTRDLQAFFVLLQALAGYLLYREQRQATDRLQSVLERTSDLLEIFRNAGVELDFDHACRLALNALCNDLQCSRAYLGVKRRGTLRVVAISGATRIDTKSPNHQPFEAAMREAVLAEKPIDFTPATAVTDANAAHEILRRETSAARLLTLPLPRRRGAVTFAWDTAPLPSAAPLVAAAAPFVPVLFDLLDRGRPSQLVFAVQRLWQRATVRRRRAIVAGAVAIAGILACPFPYHISADCRVVPTVKRVVAAPFDGQLRKSFVRPGDTVKEGEPLGELDNHELKLKEAELTAARERALKERDRAMAGGAKSEGSDFAAAQVANFEAQSVSQELQLVQRKLAMLQVTAPLSGVVVSGDLRRAEGQPVPRGQILWEVAPLDAMIVEVDIPDREISRVQEGRPMSIRLESFGGGRFETKVDRIHPQSEQRDGHNVFVAEGEIKPGPTLELRPGMHGRASITSGRHALIWILGHRLWEWVVTMLFW